MQRDPEIQDAGFTVRVTERIPKLRRWLRLPGVRWVLSALVFLSCVWGLLWAEPSRQLLKEFGTQPAMLLVLAATVAVALRR
jgi:hypothetical protein